MWVDFGGWKMDLTLCLMYMVAKISLFAWSYTDGAKTEKWEKLKLKAGNAAKDSKQP